MKSAVTRSGGGKRPAARALVHPPKSISRKRRLPDKRTIRVLMALVVGMTTLASVLMLLDPGPIHRGPALALSALEMDDPAFTEKALFSPNRPLSSDWQYIIVHDSRGQVGSANDLDRFWNQYYQGEGLSPRGAGYHFVINDAAGNADGQIEVCQRWQEQYPGGFIDAEGDDHWNRVAIGVCVMGDAERQGFSEDQLASLGRLVREMQLRLNIPRENVIVQVGQADRPAPFFPEAQFRRQLLD